MGLEIDRERFEEGDYVRFGEHLREDLAALEELLERPEFGRGEFSLGAELEVSLVDHAGLPLLRNREVLAETADPRLTVELNRFNLEANLEPGLLAGRPFTALREKILSALAELGRAAARSGGRIATIGILPTLRTSDLQESAMSDSKRFRALSHSLRRLRHEPFHVRIGGPEPLEVSCDAVTFEGANTSLQVHLRGDPDDFARHYDAAQMATLPTLAVAGNSPTFLGHRLWDETRVALFKHAVDDRGSLRSEREARVSFGTGWLQGGALSLFRESVEQHEPLLPMCGDEASLACVRAGGVPKLDALRLHHGTVWRWNRSIYDPSAGGHLRVEMRSLPSGPSPTDMAANAAFLVGLTLGLAPDAERWTRSFDFEAAHHGFYRAAQDGLSAEIPWPAEPGAPPQATPAPELVLRLLPVARRGLEAAGVEAAEAAEWLGVIEARAARGRSGARWQWATIEACEARGADRAAALARMFDRYLEASASGEPVHAWPWPGDAP